MIKKCYRLWVNAGFLQSLPVKQCNYMSDIDEDYLSKKEWLKNAKAYTTDFNEKFNTSYTYQDFFGEPDNTYWRYCTLCETSFPSDEDHEC